MAIDGKVLLLGLVAAGGVLLIATSKKAKAATPANGQTPAVGPPLQGVPVPGPQPGSVVVVPDLDDAEPDEAPPAIVVPPGGPPPFVPPGIFTGPPAPTQPLPPVVAPLPPPAPPPAATTLPGAVLQVPAVVEDILDAAGVPVVVPQPIPVTPAPSLPEVVISPPATPEQEQAEQPTELADDTVLVLDVMLGAEQGKSWKRIEPLLKPWQAKRGLTADGKFGPGSAKRMAQETGLLPIVRFWPSGALQNKAVPAYQDALIAIASTAEEPRKTQLIAAASREKGQGFGSKQGPIVPLIVFDASA